VQPVDPYWSLVFQVVTAAVAVVALILGVLNYRREKRRDEVRIHAELRSTNLKHQDGRIVALEVEGDITNTGQRTTTLQAVGLIFARRRSWRRSGHRAYVWSQSVPMPHQSQRLALTENRPVTVRWSWQQIEASLRSSDLTQPRFIGVRVRIAGDKIQDQMPRNGEKIEAVARDVMSGALSVEKRATK